MKHQTARHVAKLCLNEESKAALDMPYKHIILGKIDKLENWLSGLMDIEENWNFSGGEFNLNDCLRFLKPLRNENESI